MRGVIKYASPARVSIVVFVVLALVVTLVMLQIGEGVAKPAGPQDESKVPHYFGPYPNWANSPQTLANAIVTLSPAAPTPGSVGNQLGDRAYATDYATAPGTLGPIFVVVPSAVLPAGTLTSFETWNQATAGSSPNASAGNLFHAYVLRPTGTPDQYTIIYDSRELYRSGPYQPGGLRSNVVPCVGRRRRAGW